MAMNITGSNMAMRSQMVGLPQHTKTRATEHRMEAKTVQQPEKQKEAQKTPKETYSKGAEERPKAHQRKVEQVITRYVASTGKKSDANKAQTRDAERAREKAHTREQQGADQPKAKVPLDNAARIGLMYKSKQRQQSQQTQGRVQNDNNNQQTQQGRLRSFLSNLRQYVDMEYKQYGSTDNSLYSRRNLREILSALGHETKAFDNKAKKDRKDRTSGAAGIKSYNKNYEIRARKNLKLFQEDPMSQDPFNMVA